MRMRLWLVLSLLGIITGLNVYGEEPSSVFQPIVFWENNVDKGIILVSSTDMLIVDSRGNKYGKIHTNEPVIQAYISPNGKMLAYATTAKLWLNNLETGTTTLVANGFSHYFRWSQDGSSFFFAVGELKNTPPASLGDIKFFWADGDGKNVKQVYP